MAPPAGTCADPSPDPNPNPNPNPSPNPNPNPSPNPNPNPNPNSNPDPNLSPSPDPNPDPDPHQDLVKPETLLESPRAATLALHALHDAAAELVLAVLLRSLTTANPGGEPRNEEAKRQLLFFANSLFNTTMSKPPPVARMKSWLGLGLGLGLALSRTLTLVLILVLTLALSLTPDVGRASRRTTAKT